MGRRQGLINGFGANRASRRVSAKKCMSRSYNDGNSDCHALHGNTFIVNALFPFPSSRDFSVMRDTKLHLDSSPSPGTHAYALSFYRSSLLFLFFVFFRMTSLPHAAPGVTLAPNVTLVAVTRRRPMRDRKKSYAYVTSCHRPNQTSTYRIVDTRERAAARVHSIAFFLLPFFPFF